MADEIASRRRTRVADFVNQLKPYLTDADAYGRLLADFNDLMEASDWFLSKMESSDGKVFSASELENLLVQIDVKFVQHATFHLESVSRDLNGALENFPDSES